MIRWITLTNKTQVNDLIETSHQKPLVIFKHSTRCSVSAVAKYRLESDWSFDVAEMDAYFIDLLAHREVSNLVAETFGVYHESPQLLLIRGGECVCEASHLDISVDEIRECFQST